jgi:hypothetical protein
VDAGDLEQALYVDVKHRIDDRQRQYDVSQVT